MIKTAKIISDESQADEVGLNNMVTVYLPEDDEEVTYKIVTTVRSNTLKGKISIDSPLGKALLHGKVNDTVNVKVNDMYSYDIIIRKIEKTPDDGTDELSKY